MTLQNKRAAKKNPIGSCSDQMGQNVNFPVSHTISRQPNRPLIFDQKNRPFIFLFDGLRFYFLYFLIFFLENQTSRIFASFLSPIPPFLFFFIKVRSSLLFHFNLSLLLLCMKALNSLLRWFTIFAW